MVPFLKYIIILQFVCLMSEGVIAYYRGNACTQLCYRTEKTRTHWMLQVFGSVIGIFGIGVKIYIEQVHFHTLHGLIGKSTGVYSGLYWSFCIFKRIGQF